MLRVYSPEQALVECVRAGIPSVFYGPCVTEFPLGRIAQSLKISPSMALTFSDAPFALATPEDMQRPNPWDQEPSSEGSDSGPVSAGLSADLHQTMGLTSSDDDVAEQHARILRAAQSHAIVQIEEVLVELERDRYYEPLCGNWSPVNFTANGWGAIHELRNPEMVDTLIRCVDGEIRSHALIVAIQGAVGRLTPGVRHARTLREFHAAMGDTSPGFLGMMTSAPTRFTFPS